MKDSKLQSDIGAICMFEDEESGKWLVNVDKYQKISDLLEQAKQQERERILKIIGDDEPLPTHINDREIDDKNPFLQFCKGRNSMRKIIRKKIQTILEEETK